MGDDADPHQAAALADLDEEAVSGAGGALARVDVLRPQPPFGFVHPLIRAAVYEALTPVDRDAGHARAARLLASRERTGTGGGSPLARLPGRGRPGGRAASRGCPARGRSRCFDSAVAYLGRALAEPPQAAERVDLLLELGAAETLVSGDAAVEHLREGHELIDDPIRRAETALLLGRQLYLLLRGEEAEAVLSDALDDLAGADAELERLLEGALIDNEWHVPSLRRKATERLERIRRRPGEETAGEKLLLSKIAFRDAWTGAAPAAASVPLARRALAGGTLLKEQIFAAAFVPPCAVLTHADRDEAGDLR